MPNIKKKLGEAFLDIANAIESGHYGKKPRIGLTTSGSELGLENMLKGAELAAKASHCDIVLIGPKCASPLEQIIVPDDTSAHKKMEELLDSGELNACVTMHYSFPIGVSTVGKVLTPGFGKEMLIASTTGTSSTNRTEAMVLNGIYGIIAAKATGIENPSLGILNVDNARSVERALKELAQNGYPINFGGSARSDGGSIMRGNDLLTGSVDVMVSDSLTGNILMKMLSAFTSGGSYEASGYGYGPGIGRDYERMVLILSRASGSPVVAGAINYASALVKGGLKDIAKRELQAAKAAGLDKILATLKAQANPASMQQTSSAGKNAPAKEVVTGTINGIDIMDLDNAVEALAANGIYAESGMGCTGPIVLVNETKLVQAVEILVKEGYASKECAMCQ